MQVIPIPLQSKEICGDMGRIRIRKHYKFEAAHRLWGHDGPCANVHGHSYRLEVVLGGSALKETGNPKDGMLMDFADLDRIIHESVIHLYDHALLLNTADPLVNSGGFQNAEKVLILPYQPTCENMVADIAAKLKPLLPVKITLEQLVLHETASASAEWIP